MRGKQCPKALWLYKHRRDLLPRIGAQQQAIFDSGTSVGLMAQQLFPGGVDCAPPSPFEFAQSVVDTAAAIARGERVIYEAVSVTSLSGRAPNEANSAWKDLRHLSL